jgi:hypothetical protein
LNVTRVGPVKCLHVQASLRLHQYYLSISKTLRTFLCRPTTWPHLSPHLSQGCLTRHLVNNGHSIRCSMSDQVLLHSMNLRDCYFTLSRYHMRIYVHVMMSNSTLLPPSKTTRPQNRTSIITRSSRRGLKHSSTDYPMLHPLVTPNWECSMLWPISWTPRYKY